MAILFRQLIGAAGLVALSAPAAPGCGGWFEEAPPLLSRYLDRLPAKSFGIVYLETRPPAPSLPPVDLAQVTRLAQSVGGEPRPELLKRVDALLAAARGNYEDSYWCNLLQDVRAALLTAAADEGVKDYVAWRIDHAHWFELKPKPPRFEYPPQAHPPVAASAAAREIEERLATAPEALRAQWLYLRGALGFAVGERDECGRWFEQAVALTPPQPRAEAALFLLARCRFSQSHEEAPSSGNFAPDQDRANLAERDKTMAAEAAEARRLFERYLTQYPSGQYAADAHGWLGALDFAAGNRTDALQDYICQLETPGHPEVVKSALFMCERVMNDGEPDDSLFAILAAHPAAAMGTTYLILNSGQFGFPAQDNSDAAVSAQQKQWRARMLPRLAAAVADHKAAYSSGAWPARYLALLAQAASAAGQQDAALALTSLGDSSLEANDDLLLARGIAQQRAGRPQEAIASFRRLMACFPKSQLVRGVRLKLALALQDDHQAGLALLELKRLRDDLGASDAASADPLRFDDAVYPPADSELGLEDSAVHSNLSGAELAQIDQLIDALFNFAPLPELEAAIASTNDEPTNTALRSVLAQRFLAREDFAAARRFMTPEDYASRVEPLAELVRKAAAIPDGAIRASAMSAIGDAWEIARGKLLHEPLEGTMSGPFESQSEQGDLRRRVNAKSLGCDGIDPELENRDELRHAARWWSRAAAQAPDPTAEWKALRAIPLIANASSYAFVRAVETDEAAESKRAFQHLRSAFPDSLEAHRDAAYWSFPAAPFKSGHFPEWETDQTRELVAVGIMGYSHLDYGAFGLKTDFDEWDPAPGDRWREIARKMAALVDHPEWDNPRLAAEVDSLRQQAGAIYTSFGQISYLNVLDDLALVLREPKLTQPARTAYLKMRLAEIPAGASPVDHPEPADSPAAVPDISPIADYVDFLRAARSSADHSELAQAMADFLASHPRSAKREAAALVRARAVHWLTTPPAAFDRPRAVEPLDAYDREFPKGRYAAQIRDWRASAGFQARDWQTALDLTLPELVDDEHPDLKPEASLRLANIFAALSVDQTRPVLLEVIRSRPEAIKRLQQYLASTFNQHDHPLRYLGAYLADQLEFPAPAPPKANDNGQA